MKRLFNHYGNLVLVIILSAAASAAVPTTMNVQGRLTDAGGSPLPPGFKEFTFSIYDAEVGGNQVWTESSQFISSDAGGLWTAVLGTVDSMTSGVFSGPDRWLEITVDDGIDPPVRLPRVQMVTSPYTFEAAESDFSNYAEGAKNATNAIYADTADVALFSLPDDDWAVSDSLIETVLQRGIMRGASDNFHYGSNAHTLINLGVACTTSMAGGGSSYITIGGGFKNRALRNESTIGGGRENLATGNRSTVSGGYFNTADGTNTTVGGGHDNTAGAEDASVFGGGWNFADGSWSTVGGGVYDTADGTASTVAGGFSNTATGSFSAIAGGAHNYAPGSNAVIAGGARNSARGEYAAVLGGGGASDADSNAASGDFSAIPGGRSNVASGDYSFAGGYNAHATHDGSFVWGGNGDFSLVSTLGSDNTNSFSVWAGGGANFYTGSQFLQFTGVRLPVGGGAWLSMCDRETKTNFRPVDGAEILSKLEQLPITRWNYKTQDASIDHIGPMAQDFYRLFNVGHDDKTISTLDPDGIALAAIKELEKRNQTLQAEIAELRELVESVVRAN